LKFKNPQKPKKPKKPTGLGFLKTGFLTLLQAVPEPNKTPKNPPGWVFKNSSSPSTSFKNLAWLQACSLW